jgi:hypothetical protein
MAAKQASAKNKIFEGFFGQARYSRSSPDLFQGEIGPNPRQNWLWMSLLQPNPLLWTAIDHRNRILEPHDHGNLKARSN